MVPRGRLGSPGGTLRKRTTVELVANQVTSLERRERSEDDAPFPEDRSGGAAGGTAPAAPRSAPASGAAAPRDGGDDFDDLPF